jgi:hypothetical protein
VTVETASRDRENALGSSEWLLRIVGIALILDGPVLVHMDWAIVGRHVSKVRQEQPSANSHRRTDIGEQTSATSLMVNSDG